jgi:bacillithiol system protein YtxJ
VARTARNFLTHDAIHSAMPLQRTSFASIDDIRRAPGTTVLYKHSPTCSLCAWSIAEVEQFAKQQGVDVHLIDVFAHRPLSQAIEAHFGVRHESPQVLIIDDGRVTWHGSHRALSAERLHAAATGQHSALGTRF